MINLDNVAIFLINEISQDSLLLNVLSNIPIKKKYQSWLREKIQVKKLKVIFSLNPVAPGKNVMIELLTKDKFR